MKKIDCGLDKVDYIIHVSDIHIRNWKRHKEYQEVFDKLNELVKNAPANTIVVIGGDIVHAKTDMSPELIQMVSYFFTGLADLVPTFTICGNHDTNLNNNNRLDALTPIINALKHPNIYYLKDTDVYEVGDIALSVMSVFDEPDKYPTASSIKKKYKRKIALYHGTVENSSTDTGMKLLQGLSKKAFDNYDAALLGDIHKRQILSDKPLIFYPGSLIQQNFGEDYEGHGPAILDVNTLECKFLDIPNDYGFYTLDVVDGILPDSLPITSKTSVRLKVKNTTPAQLKRVLASLRKEYKNSDPVVVNVDTKDGDKNAEALFNSGDVRRVEYQNELIKEYLQQHNVDAETLEQIYTINKQLNGLLPSVELARNIVWKPKRFEFSNMFSYGENNVVNFTNMKGLCGLFAPNHSGKSAILDALCFCLFDHSFRASKADQVLNNKSDWFSCKFNFEIDGVDYFVEKKATRYTKGPLSGKLRVNIDFWYVSDDGEQISLNGEQRRDTDKIIQSYVGTFEDFILTALSLQNNNSNFIDKTQGERKELLANFLDLSLFDQLYDLANKETKTSAILLEEYQKQDFETKLGDAESTREKCLVEYKDCEESASALRHELQSLNDKKHTLAKQYKPNKAQHLDIDNLEKNKAECTKQMDAQMSKTTEMYASQRIVLDGISAIENSDIFKDAKTIEETYLKFTSLIKEQDALTSELNHFRVTIKSKLDKLSNLEKHEYDPNCKYCVNNVFVKDAIKTKQELDEDKKFIVSKLELKKNLDNEVDALRYIENKYADLKTKQSELKNLQDKKQLLESQIETAKSTYYGLKLKIENTEADIKIYYENEHDIDYNDQIEKQLQELQIDVDKLTANELVESKRLHDLHGQVVLCDKIISECVQSIEHMQELHDKQLAYGLYSQAMSKDGIQYVLISKAIPHIEQYVNNLLTQMVDFRLAFETDGKHINVFICYETNKWQLELSSGMERFIASLAIRVALIKATSLPKPNFIAIDEGLGVLDSSNLNSMHMLFNNMKDLFKFTMVISHIDVVRDMVDSVLTIDKNNDFSYINYQ